MAPCHFVREPAASRYTPASATMVHPLPYDHVSRMALVDLALDGLSVGDAFGERFFVHPDHLEGLIAARALPLAPWRYTDDTEMALSVVEILAHDGGIEPDALAHAFARRHARDRMRGYGRGAHTVLASIARGVPWREAARELFDGQGSMGNGAAMRVAPVGAYFADDLDALTAHARASAEVTHAHPDGVCGAVAVALAAAYAVRFRRGEGDVRDARMLAWVLDRAPSGPTRDGLARALALPDDTPVRDAARVLGSGARVLSEDTVPFALWCAERHREHYEEAMWTTVAGLGDRDTTCAIAGGVVALAAGREGIPADWMAAREALPR